MRRAGAALGTPDEGPLPDGTRLRDRLCGMLATSGVLHKLRVPFSYINNCRIDDAEFREGIDRFLRIARVVKTMKTMKIGQVGQRIDFFWSTIIAEAELLTRFGIQVLPIDLVETMRAVHGGCRRTGPPTVTNWPSSSNGSASTITLSPTTFFTTSPSATSCWSWPNATTWTASRCRTSVRFPTSWALFSSSANAWWPTQGIRRTGIGPARHG